MWPKAKGKGELEISKVKPCVIPCRDTALDRSRAGGDKN